MKMNLLILKVATLLLLCGCYIGCATSANSPDNVLIKRSADSSLFLTFPPSFDTSKIIINMLESDTSDLELFLGKKYSISYSGQDQLSGVSLTFFSDTTIKIPTDDGTTPHLRGIGRFDTITGKWKAMTGGNISTDHLVTIPFAMPGVYTLYQPIKVTYTDSMQYSSSYQNIHFTTSGRPPIPVNLNSFLPTDDLLYLNTYDTIYAFPANPTGIPTSDFSYRAFVNDIYYTDLSTNGDSIYFGTLYPQDTANTHWEYFPPSSHREDHVIITFLYPYQVEVNGPIDTLREHITIYFH